jgi:hypothetical protein
MIVEKDEGAVIHQLLGLVQSMLHAALRVACCMLHGPLQGRYGPPSFLLGLYYV